MKERLREKVRNREPRVSESLRAERARERERAGGDVPEEEKTGKSVFWAKKPSKKRRRRRKSWNQ